MAVMSAQNRLDGAAQFMRELSELAESIAATKPEVRAAFDVLDQFYSDNAAAINVALPLPFRTSATAAQKARMGVICLTKRYITGA